MTLGVAPIDVAFAPLLAAGAGIWIELTIAAIAGLLWLVNQIFNNANKPGQPPVQQRPNVPPVPQKKQPGLDDVQEFLRRAAEQRQRPPQQKEKDQRKQQRPLQQQPKKSPQQQGSRKQKSQPRPLEAEVVQEPMRERSVSAHVQKHLDPQEFKNRSEQLSSVASAPSQIDSHLHQVFDHQVGRLTRGIEADDDPAREGPQAGLPPSAAIATLFANPESFRQAFILSEILRPLDDRH